LQILVLHGDFGSKSSNKFKPLQPNSLCNGTGNFFAGTGNFSAANKEAGKKRKRPFLARLFYACRTRSVLTGLF
jgi:hypothetical protein